VSGLQDAGLRRCTVKITSNSHQILTKNLNKFILYFLVSTKKTLSHRAVTVVPKTKGIPACGLSETAESHDNIDAV
jgi:hypothetical protein